MVDEPLLRDEVGRINPPLFFNCRSVIIPPATIKIKTAFYKKL